ncbi:type II toxin-antitoxin system RelE/ParE family toxin [Corynebacterium epidermidicanis]|uniref:type II toxin-antitoxin system RelE/ParE family toxin n=1 Tax=Corynebacterium epidermidicanis TaxID=1050174 RepID=UPI000B2E77E9
MLGDIKSVGNSVQELRFHFGPGYRIYFTEFGGITVFLLAGGDKSTQSKDIATAQKMATELKEKMQ